MTLVAYRVQKPILGKDEGDIVHMEPEKAEAFKEYLAEATDEDINGVMGEEVEDTDNDVSPEAAPLEGPKKSAKALVEETLVATAEKLAQKVTAKASKAPTVPAQPKDKTGGFKSLGDFARCLAHASWGDGSARQKVYQYQMQVKAPLGANEGTNSAGGYSVIPQWSDKIFDKVREQTNLYDMLEKYDVTGNTLNIPYLNETSRADGSRFGGLQSYYITEGSSFTGSQMALGQVSLVLNKLGVFCYVTNELLADNAFNFDDYLAEKVGLELAFKINDGVINGSGSGQPTGILNQAALVTVAKDSNDAASGGDLGYPDIVNMWNQLYWPCRKTAVWLVNPLMHSRLMQMVFPNQGATNKYPAFGAFSFNAADAFPLRIFNRPVIEVENCAAPGNVGDILLADLSQLSCISKPLEIAVSDQIQFNTYQTAFRFVFRWDVKSPWPSALTLYKGAQTVSPFVAVQARGT